jgi:hypothetical protein
MPISDATIFLLLFEEESTSLDFKREQYKFVGASDDEKAELLKDILAFTNAWRRADAYILIGVEERQGAKAEIVGVSQHLNDADLQQFVNSKTDRPVEFAYSALELEGKQVGVIHIALQERPRYLVRGYGLLKAETVYLRRGTSTDIAKPGEIARMGAEPLVGAAPVPRLAVKFGDMRQRLLLEQPPEFKLTVLDIGDFEELPDYSEEPPRIGGILFPMARLVNPNYYRELAWYTIARNVCSPIQLAVTNESATVAHDVRIEVSISDAAVRFIDDRSFPERPESSSDLFLTTNRVRTILDTDVRVRKLESKWLIEATAEKVQPKSVTWVSPFSPVSK